MFSLCCSQTLLCTPVSVPVCSLVEGGAWEGGREGGEKEEGGKEVKGGCFVSRLTHLKLLLINHSSCL